MTLHQDNASYFRKMASKAKSLAHRIFWLKRAEGKEAMDKQLAADAEARRKIAERAANLNSFAHCDAPKVEIESKHPNGCIVNWQKPEKWEPDTYIVLVRGSPLEDWRSVASSNIGRDTRSQTLSRSYLAWGEYKEPYYISVAAVRDGVGRKQSETLIYPPDFRPPRILEPKEPPHRERPDPLFKPAEVKPSFEGAETGEFKPTEADLAKARAREIIGAIRTYRGWMTRKGRPYIKDFRRHLPLEPRVTYKELRKYWLMLRNAPTGD